MLSSSLPSLLAGIGPFGTPELIIIAILVAIPVGIIILVKSLSKK